MIPAIIIIVKTPAFFEFHLIELILLFRDIKIQERVYSQKIVRTKNRIIENKDKPKNEIKLNGSPSIFRIVKPLGIGIPKKNIIKKKLKVKNIRIDVKVIFF